MTPACTPTISPQATSNRYLDAAALGLARAQVGTIRLRLLKVAARVVVSVRRAVFHLAGSDPYRAILEAVFERRIGRARAAAAKGG